MKRLLIAGLFVFGGFTALSAQQIEVDEVVDFGKVKVGGPAETVVKIKNVGKKPLIISEAKPSCGCTVPDYPKAPIAPGKTADLKIKYNSTSHAGPFSKTVTVSSNSLEGDSKVLRIKGEVVE